MEMENIIRKSGAVFLIILLIVSGLMLLVPQTSLASPTNSESTVSDESEAVLDIENDDSDSAREQFFNRLSRGNGGTDWSPVEVISEPIFGQNLSWTIDQHPDVAIEGDKIYVVWGNNDNTSGSGFDTEIHYRYFDGSVWSDIQVISEPIRGQNINVGDSFVPRIVVENGKIYVTWQDSNNTHGSGTDVDVFFRCNLSGEKWGAIRVISEPVYGQDQSYFPSQWSDLAVEDGRVHVIWEDFSNLNNDGDGDFDLFYRNFLPNSALGPIQVVSEPVAGKNFCVGHSQWGKIAVEDHKIYVVWSDSNDTNGAGYDEYDIFYRYYDGNGWSGIEVLSEPIPGSDTNTEVSYSPEIAVDNGRVYVVWEDWDDYNGAGYGQNIFYRSNLSGKGWEPIQVISEPVYGQDQNNAIDPRMAVENGMIFVSWWSYDNISGSGSDCDLFYQSNITGKRWEPIQVVSEPVEGENINIGYSYVQNIAVDKGKISLVWKDDNNTNGAGDTDEDIFYRSTQLNIILDEGKVTPTSGNTSTIFNYTVKYTQVQNIAPNQIIVNIDGVDHLMKEVDPTDKNYVDGKEYYLKITRLTLGSHDYMFRAFDGINTGYLPIHQESAVYNTPPIILTQDNLTAIEDDFYSESYDFIDFDVANVGQVVIWDFSSNATWLEFNKTRAELHGTPDNDDVGQHWVNISISDTMGMDFTNFTLNVINVNDRPLINISNIETAFEDEFYIIKYSATDIDSSPANQLWSLETNAGSWLYIDSTSGVLSGTPSNDDVGKYWVNISVDDQNGGYYFTNFTLEVLNVNDPPHIDKIPSIMSVDEGAKFAYDVNATDIDSNTAINYSIISNPSTDITIHPDTGLIEWTATIEALSPPEYTLDVTVSVSDGDVIVNKSFKLDVILNLRPIALLLSPANNSYVSSSGAILMWEGHDGTNEPVTFDLYFDSDKTSVLEMNPTSRVLEDANETSYNVEDLDIGATYYWSVIPHDGLNYGSCLEDIFSFKINTPPILNEISLQKVIVGKEFKFIVSANDSDPGDINKFQFSLEDAPEGMSIDASTGEITWTPSESQVGKHTVKVLVDDGTDETTLTFEVNAAKKIPVGNSSQTFVIIYSIGFLLTLIIGTFIGGTEVGKYKFFSTVFVPLYNKLNPDKVMNNYIRGQIHGYIQAKPGDHYNSIKSALKLKNGTLTHHTKVLEKEGFISIERDGFYTRFYPRSPRARPEKLPLKEIQAELVDIIRHQQGITQHEIVGLLKQSQTAVSYNLRSLVRKNVIRFEKHGREKKYYVDEPAQTVPQAQPQGQYVVSAQQLPGGTATAVLPPANYQQSNLEVESVKQMEFEKK
jgi:DNA-binding MarR family transcriptional regulator